MASSIFEGARRPVVALVTLALVSVAPGALPEAWAQPAAASDATRGAARRKLVEGVDALKRADYQTALARFEEAYALVPSPKIHYNFGLAYAALDRPAEALAAFERFLAEAPDAPPDKREKATSLVATLRARVAETTGPDDREPAAGGAQPAGPAAAAPGRRPDATWSAAAELAEYRDEPEPAAATATADHDPLRVRRLAAISVGAAGVGLVAAGLVFGVLARREGDSLTNDSQIATADNPTPFDPGKESRGLAYERLQVVGLVVGALAVAAGAALYATSRRRAAVEPVVGSSLTGATLRLTF